MSIEMKLLLLYINVTKKKSTCTKPLSSRNDNQNQTSSNETAAVMLSSEKTVVAISTIDIPIARTNIVLIVAK